MEDISPVVAMFSVIVKHGEFLIADQLSKDFYYTETDAAIDAAEPFRTLTRFEAIKREALAYMQRHLIATMHEGQLYFKRFDTSVRRL